MNLALHYAGIAGPEMRHSDYRDKPPEVGQRQVIDPSAAGY